jgi:lysophospholipase L1-like esterase
MGQVAVRFSGPVTIATAPVIVVQGRQVRRTTPVLPEAAGPREGIEGAGERGAELALLVLRESTAAGVGAGAQADGLGRQAAIALASRAGRPVRWRVVARTGTTAERALAGLVPQLGSESCDVIAVALGVNDVLKLTSRARWERWWRAYQLASWLAERRISQAFSSSSPAKPSPGSEPPPDTRLR